MGTFDQIDIMLCAGQHKCWYLRIYFLQKIALKVLASDKKNKFNSVHADLHSCSNAVRVDVLTNVVDVDVDEVLVYLASSYHGMG